ncbi:MAG TPA: hypothetical protein VES66_11705 [Terriglobales bacterium]|nr:hypothetical protein [Terriglobales bacterium]
MALDAEQLESAGVRAEVKNTLQRAILAGIFFLVCLSLGYPTLNRYDIRTAVPDSADYAAMVSSGPQAARPAYRARVLVPYLARPFARIARGRVGSWDPTSFGLLVANSLLTAGAAYLLVTIACSVTGGFQTALVAALLYLLNFAISDLMLAGMVDSGEAFFLIAATALMLREQWRFLPLIAVLGAASKETFVVFLAMFAGTWALAAGPRRRAAFLWTTVSVVASLATAMALLSLSAGHAVWPWGFASGLSLGGGYVRSAIACLTNRTFWYVFVWLLPLGLVRIRSLPRPWVLGCAAAAVVAIALSAYHNQPQDAGAAARALFNIAGPMLSVSTALVLAPPRDWNPRGPTHPC